jgi:hypothetical protein
MAAWRPPASRSNGPSLGSADDAARAGPPRSFGDLPSCRTPPPACCRPGSGAGSPGSAQLVLLGPGLVVGRVGAPDLVPCADVYPRQLCCRIMRLLTHDGWGRDAGLVAPPDRRAARSLLARRAVLLRPDVDHRPDRRSWAPAKGFGGVMPRRCRWSWTVDRPSRFANLCSISSRTARLVHRTNGSFS